VDTDLPFVSGLIAVDKPIGLTSRDCVNRMERLLRARYPKPARIPKVGHAGTLDPLATGVLVMGIGSGVRLVPYIQQMAKQYEATFRYGCWTESGDLDGELHEEESPREPTLPELQAAAKSLTGKITQIPPATSAIKVGGKKAYKYAHQGIAVEVPSRVVQVDSIELTRYTYPELDLSIVCGSGTYIRTLGMDLAIACGTRAVMTRLRRIRIGEFILSACVELDGLNDETFELNLLPLSKGVCHLPRLLATDSQVEKLINGLKIDGNEVEVTHDGVSGAEVVAMTEASVIDSSDRLCAIVRKSEGLWCPYRVFHYRLS
jgi:tRNA pseudouridine55 synthase